MTDDLPGFIEDDQPKKKPQQPEPGAGGFNPFADVEVESNPLGLVKTPAQPVAKSSKPAAKAPAKPAEPAGFNAFAGAADAPAADVNEADVKPGQGKDLWACPHCGAKNKPERTTCRECGKSPSDPVIIPFSKTPAGRFGIPAAVIIVLALIGWLLFGGSVKLVPAGPGKVDSAIRRGGSVGAEETIHGLVFQPRERIAVSGRVLGTTRFNGFTAPWVEMLMTTRPSPPSVSISVSGRRGSRRNCAPSCSMPLAAYPVSAKVIG